MARRSFPATRGGDYWRRVYLGGNRRGGSVEKEVDANRADGSSIPRPSVLPQREHRLDQRAMRAHETRHAKRAKLRAGIENIGLAACEPVKSADQRCNRSIGKQMSDMFDRVHDAGMAAPR